MHRLLLISAVLTVTLAPGPLVAQARHWDFESPSAEWSMPAGGSGIATEPGVPLNHVFQIVATQPHHTVTVLSGSEAHPDFIASARVRVTECTGDAPAIYFYARRSAHGFRFLSIGESGANATAYFGQQATNPRLGSLPLPKGAYRKWLHVTIACLNDYFFAKVWPAGQPEPDWQIRGATAGQERGSFGIGVWTSPRTPSTAVALVDDVSFRPIDAAAAEKLGLRTHPREPLPRNVAPRTPGVWSTAKLIGLATSTLVLAVDRQRGELAHLVARRSWKEFVAADEYRPLFALTLTRPYQGQRVEISAADFRSCEAAANGESGVRLTFSRHPVLSLRVVVSARLAGESIALRARVENDSDWAIAALELPRFAQRASVGEQDELLLPWSGGAVLPEPGRYSQSRSMLYPGPAFAQFTARTSAAGSLYMAAEDAGGHCKQWRMNTGAGHWVEMTLTHLFPEQVGVSRELPYSVMLRAFDGDWRAAANIYKQWAKQQPWCRQTLAERRDVPQFLKEGCTVVIRGIQNPQGYNGFFGKDLERLPEVVAAYRQRTGAAHVIFVPYGWENRGTWAGINYFPAVPSDEAWVKTNQRLRAQGDRTAFLTSGFWWVVKRKLTGNGKAFDDTADFERRRDMVILNVDGKPWFVDNYEQTRSHGSWRGLSAKLCHGSPQAQATMRDIFLHVAALGTPLISFDQEIGGGQTVPCYSRTHGHPPGYGAWMWTDFRDLCQEILERGKPIQPELGLFLENVSELAIPVMSTYWSRQFGEVDHGAFAARGVGLFSYLYHEYVTAIGAACVQGQGASGTRPEASLRRRVLANNLTRGLIPGPFMHEVPLETQNPWLQQVAAAYFAYTRPYRRFPEYLVLGETVPPPKLDCPTTELGYYRYSRNGKPLRKGGPPVVKVTVTAPAVTCGAFRASGGSVAVVAVNTTDSLTQAVLHLAAGKTCSVYDGDRRPLGAERPTGDVALDFPPLGVRVVVVH